jgi:hypothetical protein
MGGENMGKTDGKKLIIEGDPSLKLGISEQEYKELKAKIPEMKKTGKTTKKNSGTNATVKVDREENFFNCDYPNN